MNLFVRRLSIFAGALLGLYAVYIGLICLNIYVGSDIVFKGMMLLELTEWAYSIVLEHIIFFVVYAFTLFSLLHDGYLKSTVFAAVYCLISAFRYCVLMWLGYIKLWPSTVNFLSELAQYAIVLVVCFVCVHRFNCVYSVMECGHARASTVCPSRLSIVYPNRTTLIGVRPFRTAAGVIGLGFASLRVISRIIFDVTLGGVPADLGEVFNMVVWYTVDILIGFAAYFGILLIIKLLSKQETKKENG